MVDEKRLMLRHFLAALAYRSQKALRRTRLLSSARNQESARHTNF